LSSAPATDTSRARGRRRALLQNLVLAALTVAVVFGGAEIVLRVTGLAPSRALRSADSETLVRIPGIYQPGQEFVDRVRRDLPARIRINNLGFRGPDMPEARPEGELRILALGDSYTFGDHVDTEQAYPSRLEARLAAATPGGRVRVINAGANGFSILDETELWRKAGPRLDAAIVLVTFSPNDVSDMTRPTPLIEQMAGHAGIKSAPLIGPALKILQGTAIFNGLQMLAARIRVRTGGSDAIPRTEPSRAGPEKAPEAWQAYRRGLVDLGAQLAASGRRALLIHYPSHGNVTGEETPHAAAVLPLWAGEAGMAYLDLLPAFRDAAGRGSRLYLVPADSHPSPAGQELAAEIIARSLETRGWTGAIAGEGE